MKIKKGINLPVSGIPDKTIHSSPKTSLFALRGAEDFKGLKPSLLIKEGEYVKVGQPLFQHKENPSVIFPATTSGKIVKINRGYRRKLESIVIEDDNKCSQLHKFSTQKEKLTSKIVLENLLKSGHFCAFKTRPFSKIPNPQETPNAIFVTAMDTNPLAADVNTILNSNLQYFESGINALSYLTSQEIFVCAHPSTKLPSFKQKNVLVKNFEGVHPAGNTGTHIHFLKPVNSQKTVWTINYQDVINIGALFEDNILQYDKIISIAGPKFSKPALYKTKIGANLKELLGSDYNSDNRIINGSILSGDSVKDETAFLGFTTTQISVISSTTDSRTLGWLIPWADKFSSILNVHWSSMFRKKQQNFDSGLNGSYRSIIPLGHFEKLTPLDILPTHLMRYILLRDTDMAQKLGILELDEEDITLFSYADIGKNDFLSAFRECLDKIEKEG